MITLYEKTETNFTHNGLCALDGNIKAPVVTEKLNGLFMLEFDYPTRAPYAQEITTERLIKCPVPDMDDQLFRIAYVKKQLSGITHFTAYHVFYDLVDNLIEDTFVVNKNGQQAITQILGATQYDHPFTASSNIPTYENTRMVRLNPAEALQNADIDNGFLARWGGEIIRNNFHIYMQTVRGSNNGVAIRNKKNLTGYSADIDVQSVCTRIMPQGFDGLFLPEKYVDSPRINQYIKPKIRVIKYDSVKAAVGQYQDSEDALPLSQAYDVLRTLAKQEFSSGHIDVPAATYCVAFAQLADTEEYKNFAALETVNIGDTVTVIHEEDGFDITARMVEYQYNPLTHAYINVTLGNYMPKFTDIAKDIKRMETGVSQALTEANYALLSANGKNTNFYGSVTPANSRSGDLWFKDNGDKMELWVYETREGVTQWYPLLTDLTMEEMKAELEKAAEDVLEAKAKSEEALAVGEAAQAAGDEALAVGQAAQDAADQAHIESQSALARANQAFDDAVAALDKANSAVSQAAVADAVATAAYNKSVKSTAVTYAVSSSGTTVPISEWQNTIPSTLAGQFLWTRTLITLQDDSSVTSYSVARHGETGASGAKGDKGDTGSDGMPAPTITAVREQYYLSTSTTTQSGGNWSDSVPTWVNGRYYWTRVVATYSNSTITYSTPVLATALNSSLVTALEAKTATESLQTTVSQHATQISLNASNITNLTGRVTSAETSLTVQAGQIASKANQTTVDTLTGRITSAESTIIQNAESVTLSLAKQRKAVNDLVGANVLQTAWQQGTLSTATGAESNSTSYERSGWFDVVADKRYLLQTYEGNSAYSAHGTAYLFYYRVDKTFLSYTTNGSSTAPFTAPANARYLRVRYTTTAAPDTINCYLLQTETPGGYIDMNTVTSMVKLQATTDTLLVTVSETQERIGSQYKINSWERGSLNTSSGIDTTSTTYLRSGYIDVKPADRYISQTLAGSSVTMYYHYYGQTEAYTDFVPAGIAQYSESIATNIYTDSSIISYLNEKSVESMSITGAVSTNPYTSSGDYLTIYRLPLDGNRVPNVIGWNGRKDTSDNIVMLYTNGVWEQIDTVTATANTLHQWTLTDAQRMGITGNNLHIAFFSIKNGSYAGIYNASTSPFLLNLSAGLLYQISYSGTSGAITVPANTVKMRVRVNAGSAVSPDAYTGNVYPGTVRQDYSKGESLYSALLMQRDLINLRVSKNDVINQINISTEGILIAGNKIRITGTTSIDNAVIQTAMIANLAITTAKMADLSVSTAKIADAAITNAKIANLDAGKINTGSLSADRIAAGSITSAKLTIANGYITNAMIADATIQSAKIAALDAGKITTGTLSAARIGAGSITADKVTTNFLQTLTGSSSIRITGTTISYYNGSSLTSQINSNGFELTRDGTKIGRIGTNNISGQSSWRGLVFDLEYAGNYMTWAWKESSSASSYTTKLVYYRSKLQNGMEKGFHFDDVVYLKGGQSAASGSSTVTNNWGYWTFSSTAYLTRVTTNGKAGVGLGSSSLILGSQGTWVDFSTIRAICAQLAGKTVYLPASSSGLSSWWSVTFPSMTTWST